MNIAVLTDKRQDNVMIRDCYDGYCCIINQNIILVNANSFSAPSPLYTECSQSHWGQHTAWPLTLYTENETKNICLPFCIWVPEMDGRVMWAQHGCKVTPGFAVTLGELS